MDITSRPKRVTDPLCAAERVRLICGNPCCSSSAGSKHAAATCLSRLVQAFLETNDDHDESNYQDCAGEEFDYKTDYDTSYTDQIAEIKELLDPGWQIDPFRFRLASEVKTAIEFERAKCWEKSGLFRRAISSHLCKLGYDSGICKSSWETGKGVKAGSYEYIDVVVNKNRYIIDPDFASGLEVARAKDEYNKIVAVVPEVVVARAEEVGRAVRILANAGRKSLKQQGLHVPPWRKNRYMLAKWLGSYKRTDTSNSGTVKLPHEVLTCRTVPVQGFQIVQIGRIR